MGFTRQGSALPYRPAEAHRGRMSDSIRQPALLPVDELKRGLAGTGGAMTIKHPEIRVTLDAAGDDFRIFDHVSKAMRRDEIEQFRDEALSGKDRDLLRICGRWVTLAPP
jgi:hypothetical protein